MIGDEMGKQIQREHNITEDESHAFLFADLITYMCPCKETFKAYAAYLHKGTLALKMHQRFCIYTKYLITSTMDGNFDFFPLKLPFSLIGPDVY